MHEVHGIQKINAYISYMYACVCLHTNGSNNQFHMSVLMLGKQEISLPQKVEQLPNGTSGRYDTSHMGIKKKYSCKSIKKLLLI